MEAPNGSRKAKAQLAVHGKTNACKKDRAVKQFKKQERQRSKPTKVRNLNFDLLEAISHSVPTMLSQGQHFLLLSMGLDRWPHLRLL
jgi:hypothetical protein